MARLTEEEVDTLQDLVFYHRLEVEKGESYEDYPEYLPFLRILEEKLEKYHEKHYPEEAEDGIVWAEGL